MVRKIDPEALQRWLDRQPPLNPMPPRVKAEVERILDRAARRLLLERLDADSARRMNAGRAAADLDALE